MQQILLRTNAFTISVMVACLSAGSSAWAQELDKVTFGAAWVPRLRMADSTKL